MAISKIKGGAINDDAISTAKIQDDAVTDPKIVDSYTTSVKTNPEFQGTEAARMPVGTTAERANAQSGDIRFNSTLSLMEYYDGTQWKSIDSPPVVSSLSPDSFDASGDTITITGSNFQSGATVKLVGDDGTEYVASTVTFTNSSTVSFDTTAAMASADTNDPFDVVVTNTSGLAGTIADGLDFGANPTFVTSTGTYDIYDSARGNYSFDASATSVDSDDTLSYAVTVGSLPTGASLNTSTGAITGFSAVGSDTASTFTVTATATEGDNTYTNTRQFTLNVKTPTVTSYTSTGSGTFTVPTGTTAVDVLVVAGGGEGGADFHGGGGGAGGLIYRPAFPVTPGGSVSYSVGAGGTGTQPYSLGQSYGRNGQDSTFGGLTAKGGGGGGSGGDSQASSERDGRDGGSGGGAGSYSAGGPGTFGTGTQPQQPGDSGTYGFGNPGATFGPSQGYRQGGGGGAGAAGGPGQNPVPQGGGVGGVGKQYDISGSQVYYAGGGGGSIYDNPERCPGGQGGGGTGGVGHPGDSGPGAGDAGTANRGGGGGGSERIDGGDSGGNGGSGIVIVKY